MSRLPRERVERVVPREVLVLPHAYTISDGSYAVFARSLYMNVDNRFWSKCAGASARFWENWAGQEAFCEGDKFLTKFFEFGFSDEGQAIVKGTGYLTLNAVEVGKMLQRFGGNPDAKPPLIPPMCAEGEFQVLADADGMRLRGPPLDDGYFCAPCLPGTSRKGEIVYGASEMVKPELLKTYEECDACEPGQYQPESGQGDCLPGNAGHFVGIYGATAQEACPMGTASSSLLAVACPECAAGTFSPTEGATRCEYCPRGRYNPGGSQLSGFVALGNGTAYDALSSEDFACTECPATFTTFSVGSLQFPSCVCPKDTYWNRRDDRCDPCPEGAVCPGGLHIPKVYTSTYGFAAASMAPDGSFYPQYRACSENDECKAGGEPWNMRTANLDLEVLQEQEEEKFAGTYDKAKWQVQQGGSCLLRRVVSASEVVHCPVTPVESCLFSCAFVR